jgi:hypothetical protein
MQTATHWTMRVSPTMKKIIKKVARHKGMSQSRLFKSLVLREFHAMQANPK